MTPTLSTSATRRASDPGYAGRLRWYRRALGIVLWCILAATLVWGA